MAPEQATFDALDVDTRADIYALGVILYELLTGSTPIRRETFQRAALDEILRVVREDEPPTPSQRISSSDGLPSLAANRQVEPARLGRFVRGELDWIVMKALAKERARRYDSAIGLANDVERFLNDEPVAAGPPRRRYRPGKFIRRHRGRWSRRPDRAGPRRRDRRHDARAGRGAASQGRRRRSGQPGAGRAAERREGTARPPRPPSAAAERQLSRRQDQRDPRLDLPRPRPAATPRRRGSRSRPCSASASTGRRGHRGGGDRRPAGGRPDAADPRASRSEGLRLPRPGGRSCCTKSPRPPSPKRWRPDHPEHPRQRERVWPAPTWPPAGSTGPSRCSSETLAAGRPGSAPTTPAPSSRMNNLASGLPGRRPARPGRPAHGADAGGATGEAGPGPPRTPSTA